MTRLKEILKSISIVLLMLSALYLSLRVWVYDASILPASFYEKNAKVFSFLGIDPPSAGIGIVEKSPARELAEAARPIRCAITKSDMSERCGAEYDRTQVDMIYEKTVGFIGEAIGSAARPEEITEKEWQAALGGTGIYYDYLAEIPLSAIALWQNYEPPAHIDSTVRRLALAVEGDGTALYYVNELNGRYYRCRTAAESGPVLEQIGTYKPNGCAFAFERKDLSPKPMAELFIFGASPIMRAASSMPVPEDEEVFDTLLRAFGIRLGSRTRPQNLRDALLAVEGSRSLSLSTKGEVIYSDNMEESDGRIVIYVPQREPSEAELIENIRILAENTAGAFCGEAEIYIKDFRRDKTGRIYTLSFAYVLNGVPVQLSDSTHAAVFRIEDGALAYARIVLREFALENDPCVPMPLETAIQLEKSGVDCRLSYREARSADGGLMSIGWYK